MLRASRNGLLGCGNGIQVGDYDQDGRDEVMCRGRNLIIFEIDDSGEFVEAFRTGLGASN